MLFRLRMKLKNNIGETPCCIAVTRKFSYDLEGDGYEENSSRIRTPLYMRTPFLYKDKLYFFVISNLRLKNGKFLNL